MTSRKQIATETVTDEKVRKMISAWLTGNDEADAKSLARMFRFGGIGFWRKAVQECRENA